ncbi:MAG: PAS domain-containing protein [Halorhabdus sp.]
MEMVRGQSQSLIGYTAEEIERGEVSWGEDVVHQEDRERVWETVNRAIANDESFELTYRILTKSGDQRWVREQGQQVSDQLSDEAWIEGFITDVTEQKEREREVQTLKERFELALDAANLGVWDWDWKTGDVEFNDNLVRMLGYDPAAVPSQIERWKTIVHPADRSTLERTIEEHNSAETAYYDTEFRVRTADDEWKWIRMIGQISSRDDDGEPLRAVGINSDVNERKTVEEELRRERDRLEALHDAATDIGAAGSESVVYETLTTVAEDILDFAEVAVDVVEDDALVQQAWSRDESGDFYERVPLDEDTFSTRAYHRGETIVADDLTNYDATPADPEYRSALTVPIGDIGTFQAVSREVGAFDETDRELAELLVGHAREALLRIDQERSLREQRERLRRENERLQEFASFVSHDLRNPLNVANGRLAQARSERDSEHLAAIERSLERMDALITDLLALARQGNTVGEVETVSIEELVSECWKTVETPESVVQTDAPPTIRADPERLKTVLENLFRNAMEHGGDGITVTVGALDEREGFYVADDGTGIPSENAGNVFETGYSTRQDGTGIGLSIVEQIVDAHGWEIDVTASATGGARFEISGVETVQP